MKENMDDGEIELSDHLKLLPNSDSSSNNIQLSLSSDSILDDFLRNSQTCTHTHTCNPPGPDDTSHTHTCYHTHTHLIPSEEDNGPCDKAKQRPGLKTRKPLGNREAVRKYREKKKAQAAFLEEEVKKLRFVNQQLVRKLQRQAVLETEVLRLRELLVNLRGKIDIELGNFPFEKRCNNAISAFKEGECRISNGCGNMMNGWDCGPAVLDCIGNGGKVFGDSSRDLAPSANQEE